MASSTASSDDLIAPYEIVFSCSLCQKTITDLYTKPPGDKSLNNGFDGSETVATKLWMTECGHITCGEHLKGGGVPFHPVDERPKAACPVCVKERADLSYKNLFGIVSSLPGEHDTAIPHEFFDTPPAESLTASSPAAKAIRFQYLSMLRYGRAMRQRVDEAKQSLDTRDKRMRQHLAFIQALKEEVTALRSNIDRLEAVEKKYQTYKDREPEIKHYLEQFSGIARENTLLKNQLVDLGYAVPQTEWSMKKPPPMGGAIPFSQADDPPRSEQQPVMAVDTTPRDRYRQSDMQCLSSSTSRKRTRKDYLEGLTDADLEVLMDAPVQQRRGTRESMWEPLLPTQRAAQTTLPIRNNQFERSSSQRYLDPRSKIDAHSCSDVPEVQMYQNSAWNDARHENAASQSSRPSQPSGPALMGGSLGAAPGWHGFRIDQQKAGVEQQPRLTRPAPEWRTGAEGYSHRAMPQFESDLRQHQQNPNDSSRGVQTPVARMLHSRAASRSSFVRQSLIPALSRGNIRGPDSGYHSNGKPQHISDYKYMDENYAPAPPRQTDRVSQPSFDSPFFKPHFNGPVPQQESPVYQRGATRQSEQLVSGLRHLRMEPASQQPQPRLRPSLNALSFIDEPYTATNQPIYAQQRGPLSQSREEQTYQYRPAVISHAGFIQDPRVPQQPRRQPNTIRLPSAMPSSSQPLAHMSKGSKSGGSMVRSIGVQRVRPSTNSYSPGGGYFPRTNAGAVSSRGIFSAAGRRSVRR
ncbi:hypothetical protein E2P81_ATG01736 [Venturia nashicola]|uniref:Uncharacterized protein n=1 Tax=Venturia nashicola TaxID=86259 RepID=A0A4Z1NM05_9PEZI|nr:hypothetical protein E6O75_ATG01781 [Venturia nashicola]TLD19008.1 hypothetical protein E2P81_ATG01736 [Venturia nashicola]